MPNDQLSMMRKILFGFLFLVVLAGIGAGVFLYRAKTVRSEFVGERVFHIETSEDILSIADRLESDGLVRSKWYFLWSAWRMGLRGNVQAGDFVISGKRTAGEVVATLLSEEGKPKEITITFPEGWTAEKMAARLSANQFDGEQFLTLVKSPKEEWRDRFPVLETLPKGAALEGFLFPDTYAFFLDATPEDIIANMLRNFEKRFTSDFRAEAKRQGKSVFDIVIMASIVEREIGTANQAIETIARDRKMVSDLFWRRLKNGQRLESDATLAYARGESKVQHSIEETRFNSPYNTYENAGLPPGPIANPGLLSLQSALFPEPNTFVFFLNNPETGETFFAETFEGHQRNKMRNGL